MTTKKIEPKPVPRARKSEPRVASQPQKVASKPAPKPVPRSLKMNLVVGSMMPGRVELKWIVDDKPDDAARVYHLCIDDKKVAEFEAPLESGSASFDVSSSAHAAYFVAIGPAGQSRRFEEVWFTPPRAHKSVASS